MEDNLSINNFNDYVQALLDSDRAVRLLFVCVEFGERAGPDDPAEVARVFDLPLTPELRFEDVLERAPGHWEFVVVNAITRPDGAPPSGEEAEPFLQAMTLVITGESDGDVSGYQAFDRQGRRLRAG